MGFRRGAGGAAVARFLLLCLLLVGGAVSSAAQELPAPTGELKAMMDYRYFLVYGTFPSPTPSPTPSRTPTPTPTPVSTASTKSFLERGEYCCQRIRLEPEPSPACLAALQLGGVQLYPNYDADHGLLVCANVPGILEVSASCNGSTIWFGGCFTF